jgi:hypothetical protein
LINAVAKPNAIPIVRVNKWLDRISGRAARGIKNGNRWGIISIGHRTYIKVYVSRRWRGTTVGVAYSTCGVRDWSAIVFVAVVVVVRCTTQRIYIETK